MRAILSRSLHCATPHAKCACRKKRNHFGRGDRREGHPVNGLPGRHIDGRIVSFNEGTGWMCEFLWLVGVGEVVELGFEGLIVLALDLELGLEFFDQEFEARDFGAEF